jgi:hypothetical protein
MRKFLVDLVSTAWVFTMWVLLPLAALVTICYYLPA